MSYTVEDFKTVEELEEAVESGREVRCFQPDYKGPDLRTFTGAVSVEGPHSPEERNWVAQVELRDGVIIKVIKSESFTVDVVDPHTKAVKKSAHDTPYKTVDTFDAKKDHPAKTTVKEETQTKTKKEDGKTTTTEKETVTTTKKKSDDTWFETE